MIKDEKFILISLDFKKQADVDMIVDNLDRAIDWVEFLPRQWLLWTNNSASVWWSRLKPFVREGDHIFICELLPDKRAGRMPSAFWKFINDRLEDNKSL